MSGNELKQQRWVVGITGASGAIIGVTLCRFLLEKGIHVHLVITDAGWRVLGDELGWVASRKKEMLEDNFSPWLARLSYHPLQDIGASVASGSFRVNGMVIVPCSMGTLAAVAAGMSGNLLQRAADVTLKEGRRLIIMPRETPLSTIHLENLLRLSRLGVHVIPAMPAFYNQPETINDIVHYLVGKVLDSMQIKNQIYTRWGGEEDVIQS